MATLLMTSALDWSCCTMTLDPDLVRLAHYLKPHYCKINTHQAPVYKTCFSASDASLNLVFSHSLADGLPDCRRWHRCRPNPDTDKRDPDKHWQKLECKLFIETIGLSTAKPASQLWAPRRHCIRFLYSAKGGLTHVKGLDHHFHQEAQSAVTVPVNDGARPIGAIYFHRSDTLTPPSHGSAKYKSADTYAKGSVRGSCEA